MRNRECFVFERTRDKELAENPRAVCVLNVSPVHHLHHIIIYHWLPLRKNNNPAKFMLFLKQNNSEGLIGAP